MNFSNFRAGFITCLPLAATVFPFAIIAAVSAGEAGLDILQTVGLSLFIFAGASQLAALELAKEGAPGLLIITVVVVVNLRFMMYSAAFAPHIRSISRRARALMTYLLTDQAFALSLPVFEKDGAERGGDFYFGVAAALWCAWQTGSALGIYLGAGVPPELSLDFSVALAFIALSVPHVKNRATLFAALASMGVFYLVSSLPYGLALLPAAAAGIGAGMLTEKVTA